MTENVNDIMIERFDRDTQIRVPCLRQLWTFSPPLRRVWFGDDGTVFCDGKIVGVIESGISGLWRFWRNTPDGTIPLPGFYPSYAIAEVGVRAFLENEDEPEIGNPHYGE